jgi:hypothetical protein
MMPADPIRWAPIGVVTAIVTVIRVIPRRIPDRKVVWIKIGAVIGKHPGPIAPGPPWVHADIGEHWGVRAVIPPQGRPLCVVIAILTGD